MAGGRSKPSIPARCQSRRTRARAGRAGGTPSAPYGCWIGIQCETNAHAAGRRLPTTRPGPFSSTADTKVAFSAAREKMMDTRMPFVPFQPDQNSYVLPKVSRSSSGPAAPELPIPPPELWLGYGRSTEEYLAFGRKNVQTMLDLLRASGARLERGTRILDFGCGAGRMIR